MTPDCFDSTALPDGPPHLIDRLDAAIAWGQEGLKWPDPLDGTVVLGHGDLKTLVDLVREARAVLDAEGFGR